MIIFITEKLKSDPCQIFEIISFIIKADFHIDSLSSNKNCCAFIRIHIIFRMGMGINPPPPLLYLSLMHYCDLVLILNACTPFLD